MPNNAPDPNPITRLRDRLADAVRQPTPRLPKATDQCPTGTSLRDFFTGGLARDVENGGRRDR